MFVISNSRDSQLILSGLEIKEGEIGVEGWGRDLHVKKDERISKKKLLPMFFS